LIPVFPCKSVLICGQPCFYPQISAAVLFVFVCVNLWTIRIFIHRFSQK
jgi:hypothetical protein